MKTIALAVLLGLCTPAFAKPSDADVKAALKAVQVFAGAELDDENRARLLFQSCSEIASCAAGCGPSLAACAQADPDQRPKLLVLSQDRCPAIDFKAQRRADPKLTAERWIDGYFKRFLDAVGPFVSKYDRPMWLEHRKKAKL